MNVSKILYHSEYDWLRCNRKKSADKQLLVCKLNAFPLTRNNYMIPKIVIKLEKSILEAIYYCLLPPVY